MSGAGRRWCRIPVATVVLIAVSVGCGACSGTQPSGSAAVTSTSHAIRSGPTTTPPLPAPATSVVQDGKYFTDVAEVDPTLATYEEQQGNVALRALLTDGSAFCAFMARGGGIDQALVSVAEGARGDESQTHLPLSVTTLNTVEGVALLTLCPSDQRLLPASDRSKIHALGVSLAGRSG
jgi:hypothetical protein